MRFHIELDPDGGVVLVSYPTGDDERIHSRNRITKGTVFGMTIDELSGYCEIVTSNEDGSVISKTKRPENPQPFKGELPAWVKKRDN